MTVLPSFGYMLAAYRKARDLSHEQLAEQIRCPAETIRQIEMGKLRASKPLAEQLAAQLAIPPGERALFIKAAHVEMPAIQPPLGHGRPIYPETPIAGAARPISAPKATLPQGEVTFLFTDIEGSTQLWERHPQDMRLALARHDALLRERVEAHRGMVFKTTGDGLHAVFARAPDAVGAAVAMQRALRAEPWGPTGRLRVRIAIHTGAVEERDGDYFGAPVNRVARLLSAGHGDQILLSGATEELVRDELPAELGLRDLGAHSLKDLTRPEQIFQVTASDLPASFPALRTLAERRTNLPPQPTPLIGREQDVATLCDRLRQPDVRMLTLTGPGGIGKTRLAIQVAADMRDDFPAGVCFVNLASISDASLVACSIALPLGVCESGGQPLFTRLQAELGEKQLLLLLDNFEQVAAAAPIVADLLSACPHLKVLITSRQALHLRGEKEYPVPPLALPPSTDDRQPTTGDAQEGVVRSRWSVVGQYAAVNLFIQRARDVKPDFQVTDETAAAVAEICRRLDGLPLAIELAAGWIRLLPARALLAQLEHSLPLLTAGARDLPARQQTLRSTIAWSYDLLDAEAQRLFRRLAVFVGGCTLEAADAVCEAWGLGLEAWQDAEIASPNPQAPSLINGLASLADQSLLRQIEGVDGAPRFVMLETIREYALERLQEHRELDISRQRHAGWYLGLALAAEPALTGPRQQLWLGRLEQDHGNLRAAIQWALDRQDAEMALELCAALWKFWQFHDHYSLGLRWMEAALALRGDRRSPLRARVLCGAGWLAFSQGDEARAQRWFADSLALARRRRDRASTAMALHGVGQIAQLQGDHAAARASYEESLKLFRDLGNSEEIAWSLHHLGKLACEQGDTARAAMLMEECLSIFRQVGHTWGITLALRHLGYIAHMHGDVAEATGRYQEALSLLRDLGDRASCVWTLVYLAEAALLQGDDARAAACFRESLALAEELGDSQAVAWCLVGLARLATTRLSAEQAAVFFGAAEALLDALGAQLSLGEQAEWDQHIAAVRDRLDRAAFVAAWAKGRAMTIEQTTAFEPAGAQPGPKMPSRALPSPP